MSSTPGSERFPEGRHGNPLQYPCSENPMDNGAWLATVHRVAKSQTWLKWLSMHSCMTWLIAMILFSWMLKFKPGFSLSSATFIKRLLIPLCFLPERWSHLHNWDYWYFSQWSWFQLVIHPTLHLAWCTPHISQICRVMIYSLGILLFQLNQFIVLCLVLIVASWLAYRFLRRQVRFSVITISLRIFHSLLWSTQRLLSSHRRRGRCFYGIPLLSLWPKRYWQFDLCFLHIF